MASFKLLGKPAKRAFTAQTRSTRGPKTVRIDVPLAIDTEEVNLTPGQVPQFTVTANTLGTTVTAAAPLPPANEDGHVDDTNDATPKVTKHHQKRIKSANSWSSLRNGLVQRLVMEAYPSTFTCYVCEKIPPEAMIYRCRDCGPMSYFCKECLTAQHQSSLHSLEVWNQEKHHFQNYWLPTTWKRRDGHKCKTNKYLDIIVVLDDRGQQRPQKMEFCSCEERALTLLSYGLWPASPEIPTVAFTIELMLTLRVLVLEGQLPLTAFCHGMQRYRVCMKPADWVADISRVLRWEVLLNFMEIYHDTKFLQYAGNIHKPLECMACPQDDDGKGKIISMDGNFRLVHRRAAGGPALQPRHSESFFIPQSEVDDFVAAHTATRKAHNKTCSNFQADSVLRTKNKTEKLDVTGVFGAVCSHDFPQKFFNMRFGERIAYPVLMMSSIKNIKILLYDIGCQLETHLLKNSIPYDCKIGVGIFHIYGHQRSCQLKYSPRTLEGAGLSDGEGTERIWSYLGRFASISKEMTSENRTDILNEAVLHYGNRITMKIGCTLCQRLEKAYMLKDSTEKNLNNFIVEHPGTTHDMFGVWSASEQVSKPKAAVHSTEWRMDYAVTLFDFFKEQKKVEKELAESDDDIADTSTEDLDKLDSCLRKHERKHKMDRWASVSPEFTRTLELACDNKRQERLEEVREQAVEYTHMEQLRYKYSNGQALAHRISAQIHKASKKLTDAIDKYNSLPPHGPITTPHRIQRSDILPLESPFWMNIMDNDEDEVYVTGTEKRKCIDAYRLKRRATEEIKRTVGDMTILIEKLEERLLLIQDSLLHNSAIKEPSHLDLAIRAELTKHQIASKADFESISELFSKSSRPHAIDMVAFIEIIEDNLSKRTLPMEQEGLSAESISDVLSSVQRIEEECESYEEDSEYFDHCGR